jgi:hypothetical protein
MHLPWLLFECDNNQYILIFVADGQGVKVSATSVTDADLFVDNNYPMQTLSTLAV